MTINNDLIDQLLKDYQKPEDILGEQGLLKQLADSSCKCNQRLFEIDLMRRFVAERLPGAVVEPLHDVRDL